MAKIMVLVPNQEMADYTTEIVKNEQIESCEVEVTLTQGAVAAARTAIENGAGVIVARGLQADLIREYTKVPLVEISLTGQEIGLLVQEAKKIAHKSHPNLAFVGHRTMFPDTSYMDEIFDVNLVIYAFEDRNKIEEQVQKALAEGADVVIGGEQVITMMQHSSIPSLFLRAREDSIRKALHVASKVIYTARVEKENAAQFFTVLDTVYSGVIKVDGEKCITAANHAMGLILGNQEKVIEGKSLQEVLPMLEEGYIDKILMGKQDVLTTVLTISKDSYMVSIAPIAYDEIITGAILTLQKLNSGKHKKEEIPQSNVLLGYLTGGDFGKIETKNEAMKLCIELAKTFALSQSPVIIYGETGTEKELFAQGIHNYGYQKDSRYITVNCSGMEEAQQLDALFGWVQEDGTIKKGALEQASFGTLLIRDIDELSLRCQYRLLRVMRYKIFMQTDIEEVPAMEVRILATARGELAQKVRLGTFREDLYYLLNAFAIHIPPIRERQEDISLMVQNNIKQYNKKYSRRVTLTQGGMEELMSYEWSGNTLQLERFCERLVLTAARRNVDEVLLRNLLSELYPVDIFHGEKIPVAYENKEAAEIRRTLEKYRGSRKETAAELHISTATLWRKMKKYGIVQL